MSNVCARICVRVEHQPGVGRQKTAMNGQRGKEIGTQPSPCRNALQPIGAGLARNSFPTAHWDGSLDVASSLRLESFGPEGQRYTSCSNPLLSTACAKPPSQKARKSVSVRINPLYFLKFFSLTWAKLPCNATMPEAALLHRARPESLTSPKTPPLHRSILRIAKCTSKSP
jgi:hypothetical protein